MDDDKIHKFLLQQYACVYKYKVHLQKYERENIADALVSQAFAKGQEVVKQASFDLCNFHFPRLDCPRLTNTKQSLSNALSLPLSATGSIEQTAKYTF